MAQKKPATLFFIVMCGIAVFVSSTFASAPAKSTLQSAGSVNKAKANSKRDFLKADPTGKKSAQLADPPEEAIRQMEAAHKAGDLNGLLELLAEPLRTQVIETLKAVRDKPNEAIADVKAVGEALDKKFGKAPPSTLDELTEDMEEEVSNSPNSTDTIAEDLKRLISMSIVKKKIIGDHFEFTVTSVSKSEDDDGTETKTEKITVIKQNEAWKLIPSKFQEDVAEVNQFLEYFQCLSNWSKKVVSDIEAGKYKTRQEAEEDIDNKINNPCD